MNIKFQKNSSKSTERERPEALGGGGKIGSVRLNFERSHHIVVALDILESFAFVLRHFLGRHCRRRGERKQGFERVRNGGF